MRRRGVVPSRHPPYRSCACLRECGWLCRGRGARGAPPTFCGNGWIIGGVVFHHGRAVSMKPPPSTPFMARAMDILDAARFRHVNGAWFLALFLVMPDHIHLIAKFPTGAAAVSSKPPYRANPAAVSSRPPFRGNRRNSGRAASTCRRAKHPGVPPRVRARVMV